MFCTYWMIWPCGVFWYYCVSDVFGFLKENRTHLWPGLVWSIILFLLWRSFPNVIYCDLPVICNKLTFLLYLFPCFKCFLHLWKSWSRFDCCLAWIWKSGEDSSPFHASPPSLLLLSTILLIIFAVAFLSGFTVVIKYCWLALLTWLLSIKMVMLTKMVMHGIYESESTLACFCTYVWSCRSAGDLFACHPLMVALWNNGCTWLIKGGVIKVLNLWHITLLCSS